MLPSNLLNDSRGGRDLAIFLREIEQVPWFANLGQPVVDPGIKQIRNWSEWPGPQDCDVIEPMHRQQEFYDTLMGGAGARREQAEQVWNHIDALVIAAASPRVPYDSGKDSWHGPNLAVWSAWWTAGLVGLCRHLEQPLPAELEQQWHWYREGHWPCGWIGDFPKGKLLVY